MAKYVKTEQGYQEVEAVNSNKMDKDNPVGTGSFSMGRKYGSVIGRDSHAEGYDTTASGPDSHAEGLNTTASNESSHAEGLDTTASGKCQHVQGKYNVVDSQGKYAHIVGNGVSNTARSNAHTLDWNGVPWFQGRPQFGGTEMDNGSQTVMANGDKEIILASSTADSTKKFKITVDDNGTLSATEVI